MIDECNVQFFLICKYKVCLIVLFRTKSIKGRGGDNPMTVHHPSVGTGTSINLARQISSEFTINTTMQRVTERYQDARSYQIRQLSTEGYSDVTAVLIEIS